MNKIMILGASATQVPLIQQAKAMGLYTIVVSIPGNYPGFSYADSIMYINTTDKHAILKEAMKAKIDGIVTTGTDVAVRSIGFVNSKMGLHGITEESSLLVTDKAKMKLAMAESGVSTADFMVIYSYEEAVEACKKIGYPVMAKCTDQAASKGITRVKNADELKAAVENAFSWTKKEYIIIEKYIDGYEVGMDGYIDDDGKCICLPHNKMTFFNGKTNVPIGHSVPFDIRTEQDYDSLISEVTNCANALKLRGCFFNTDVMMHNGKAYIIEMGGRTGSTCIPDILSKYCGYNYYEKMLLNALGKDVDMEFKPQCACAAGFIMATQNGVIKSLPEINEEEKHYSDYVFDVIAGDNVRKFMLGNDRIGQVMCTADSLELAESRFNKIQKELSEGILYG